MAKENNLVVGLDIGTTKICAIIGEERNGQVDIIGIGTHPSYGLRKGVVVNIESTVESIKSAVEEAEMMAGLEVDSVFVGIAGGHIRGFNSHGIIAVKNNEVTVAEVNRVIDAAKAIAIPLDREVIHVLPQEYILDEQDGIREPIGMTGVRLEAKIHIITGAVTSAQNIIRSVNRAGLEVEDIIVEQLASCEAVLDREEKELGCALVDIGGGTSDLAIFFEDSIKHTSVLSIGGNHLTNDLSIGLRTPTKEAERIKKTYGCAAAELVGQNETIEVPSVGGRNSRVLSRRVLCDILEPRVEEIFELIKRELTESGFKDLMASGLVLTGGAACMQGMVEVAERILDMPVRVGFPKGISGLVDVVNSPQYATSVGLVLFGTRNRKAGKSHELKGRNLFNKICTRMKGLVEEFF